MRKKTYRIGVILFMLLCVCLQSGSLCIAVNRDVNLQIETLPNVEEDGSFFVRLSVRQIDPEKGIVCAVFHVHYDPSLLQLVSWENETPSGWDFNGTDAEDWTTVVETDTDTYLMFTQLNADQTAAVRKDGELQTVLQFKAYSRELTSCELTVTDICFATGSLTDTVLLPDQSFTIDIPDFFNSTENEGKALKITIAVLAALAVLGASVCTFMVARKRKLV